MLRQSLVGPEQRRAEGLSARINELEAELSQVRRSLRHRENR